jgi:hypothetical protein
VAQDLERRGLLAVPQRRIFEIFLLPWHTGVVAELEFGSVLLIAVGLSAACFAVALGASPTVMGKRLRFCLCWRRDEITVSHVLIFGGPDRVRSLGCYCGET